MRKIKFDASFFLLGAIILLLAGGIVFAAVALRSDPIEDALSGDRVINTLFVIEHGAKPIGAYVLLYYPATKRAAVFDIPGELGLIIQQIKRVDRIDSVYDPRHIGPFEQEIERLLGIDISYSLVMEMENLGKIVDLIEGVEIFIPSPVELYQETPPVLFPSGFTRLDGEKSKLYLTYEIPEENAELAHFRRQRFFQGLIKRLGEQNAVLKNPPVAKIYYAFIKSAASQRSRTRLFDELAGIDTDRLNIQSVGGNPREVSGQTLILPSEDGDLIKRIVLQTSGILSRPAEGFSGERIFTVDVLNGTTVAGLAGRTAELLRGFGYDVINIGNADQDDYDGTFIIDRSGSGEIAREFAETIRCKDIRFEQVSPEDPELDLNIRNFNYTSDFTLVIGKDFDGRYVTGR
ncbi:LytR family transcriptional regulator [Spirochaetia bacterium]|nr:LytR family transcriptional regulator [Spirochaetia bacterium]